MADSLTYIIILFGIFQLYIDAAPCTSGTVTGSPSALSDALDMPLFDKFGTLMFDSSWRMPCCGEVEEWQFYAVALEDIHFQIWRPVNEATGVWKLVGDTMIPVDNQGIYSKPQSPADRIPIQMGDALGWYGDFYDVIQYNEYVCMGTCTTEYYEFDLDPYRSPVTVDGIPNTYYVGQTHTFSPKVVTARDYGIKAIVGPGAVPTIDNLPAQVDIMTTEPVDSVIFNITFSDNNTYDVPEITVISPVSTAPFSVNQTTGQVTVASDLSALAGVYIFSIAATDGCNLSPQYNLTIDLQAPTTTAALVTTTVATTTTEATTVAESTTLETTTLETTVADTTTLETTTLETTVADTTTLSATTAQTTSAEATTQTTSQTTTIPSTLSTSVSTDGTTTVTVDPSTQSSTASTLSTGSTVGSTPSSTTSPPIVTPASTSTTTTPAVTPAPSTTNQLTVISTAASATKPEEGVSQFEIILIAMVSALGLISVAGVATGAILCYKYGKLHRRMRVGNDSRVNNNLVKQNNLEAQQRPASRENNRVKSSKQDRKVDPNEYDITPPNTPKTPRTITPRDVTVNETRMNMKYRDMQFWGFQSSKN